MNIVLIGFMCAGKSRVGRMLAQQLGWNFIDTDKLIEEKVGTTIATYITRQGEEPFRQVERAVVSQAGTMDKSVIATGGGVPLDGENMRVLSKNGQFVWLKVSPNTVLKRIGNIASRPLIDSANPLESISTRLAQREPFYSVAKFSVDTDHGKPEETVQKIMRFFPNISS